MSGPSRFTILPVATPADLADAIRLFRLYAGSLGIDLGYQGFESEMAAMPGRYAPPSGALLLARGSDGRALGCVGMRALEPGVCEMKRLFVCPEGRGIRIGRALAERVIAEAGRLGYAEMRLDTLSDMADAQALYTSLGFAPMAPYYESPVTGTLFMRLRLN